MVHIWHVKQSSAVEIYAMSYAEAADLLTRTSTYAQTKSWNKPMGHYDTAPILTTSTLWKSMQPFRMGKDKWRERLERS